MARNKNVYITPGGGSFVIWFSQNDVGNTAELSLRDESGYYEIPTGAVVKIAGTKPSGLGFNEIVTYNGHDITVTATEVMTDEAGFIECEIVITKGGLRIGSGNGHLGIERNPRPEGTTDGRAETLVPELTILVERIEGDAEQIEATMAELKAGAETAAGNAAASAETAAEEAAEATAAADEVRELIHDLTTPIWFDSEGYLCF